MELTERCVVYTLSKRKIYMSRTSLKPSVQSETLTKKYIYVHTYIFVY